MECSAAIYWSGSEFTAVFAVKAQPVSQRSPVCLPLTPLSSLSWLLSPLFTIPIQVLQFSARKSCRAWLEADSRLSCILTNRECEWVSECVIHPAGRPSRFGDVTPKKEQWYLNTFGLVENVWETIWTDSEKKKERLRMFFRRTHRLEAAMQNNPNRKIVWLRGWAAVCVPLILQ